LLSAGCSWGTAPEAALEKELARARLFLESLNFNDAGGVYRELVDRLAVDDPHWPEAAFGYASSLWHQTPPSQRAVAEATALFQRIAVEKPATEWAQAALLNLARIEMLRDFPGDVENPTGAIPILEELVAGGSGFIRHEALLRLVECHRMDFHDWASVETGLRRLRDWLDQYPDNPLASVMWEQVANMELLDFKREAAALEAFTEAAAIGFADPSRAGQLLWLMGELAREQRLFEQAARSYRQLIIEAPFSGRAYEARQMLEWIRETIPGMQHIDIPQPTILTRD
jgi:tetratricopeptide (TPR) repeat protein